MTLQEKLAVVEKSQRLLQEEIQRIRLEAKVLEEENQRLKLQLCQVGDGDYQQVNENSLKIQQTAKSNLEKLYSEGFHVCHLFFGRTRTGECLFCQGLLSE